MAAASLTLDLVAEADIPKLAVPSQRPTSINLAGSDKPQQQQQLHGSLRESSMQLQLASPTTPATSGTLSPSGSATSMSPSSASFLPEMPQWKKDLIQRRKTNAARSNVVGAGGYGGGPLSPLPSPQQHRFGFGGTAAFAASHETDGLHSPTKDFILKSTQYTAKVCRNATKTTTNITSQQQQQQQQEVEEGEEEEFVTRTTTTAMAPQLHQQRLQQHLTAEEHQLQQQRTATKTTTTTSTAINAIKTPASTNTNINLQQQQYNEDDVDPVISPPTTKEETAEQFIGGHSTPQVSSSGSSNSMDLHNIVGPSTTANTAPIPKQRSLFVAPTKLLYAKEPDSCTNSFATASSSSSTTTRLTSLSSPTSTMEEQIKQQQHNTTNKSRVEKEVPTERDQNMQEAAAAVIIQKEVVEETSTSTTTATKAHNKHTLTINKCGTYSSSSSTPILTQSQPPRSIVEKSTTATATTTSGTTVLTPNATGSPLFQSHSSNESGRSSFTVTSASVNCALLSPTTTTIQTTATNKKLLDIEKFDKSNKISTKLQSNQFIKNQAAAAGGITAKYLKHRTAAAVAQEQSPSASYGATCSTAASPTNSNHTTKTTATPAGKKKMVAVQEMKKTSTNHHIIGGTANPATTTCGRQQQRPPSSATDNSSDFDPSEDLSYGPGIVSKLRCRYLSLALRESMEKQRHALDTLRRATSLNNLLDRDDQHKHADEDEDDDEDDNQLEGVGDYSEDQENLPPRPAAGGGILRTHEQQQQQNVIKKTATFQKYATAANAHNRMSQSQNNDATPVDNNIRSRHVKRGNDSLKRARSVEALLCEKSPWNFVYNRSSLDPSKIPLPPSSSSNRSGIVNVTIEDKINNARERLVLGTDTMPPRRLTSIIDDTERPPPDLVKQTLKKFEATANRRSRGLNRTQGNGEVANKVANYRSIIKEQKPPIIFPKPSAPPRSPTKKAAVKIPVVATVDLIGSPIGRKTSTAAAAATLTTTTTAAVANIASPISGFQPTGAETSTPKQKLPVVIMDFTPPARVAATKSLVGLSANSPDIIPRHNNNNKFQCETAVSGVNVAVDSPVTALAKKLEKLRLDTDKTAKQGSPNVIAKESQTKPNQLQLLQQQADGGTESSVQFGAFDLVGGDAATLLDKADKNSSNSNNNGSDTRSYKNKSNDGDGSSTDNDKNTNEQIDDDDDDDDDDDRRCAEAESVKAGTGTASSDLSDDECGLTSKRVSKTALENIAKAGTSQQFKFAGSQKPSAAITTEAPTTITATGKQIGIIRPLHQHCASNSTSSLASTNSSNESFAAAKSQTANGSNPQQLMDTLKHNQQPALYTGSHTNTHFATTNTHAHTHQPPVLTSREIEKNRINEMKKTATAAVAPSSPYAVAASASTPPAAATTTSLDTVIVTGGSSSNNKASGLSELDAAATIQHNSSPLWALQTKKKRQPPAAVAENNTMVFNFSNRKEVPDYIENDGVVIRRKRELPKPNESGFVLLGDLSLETSTDSDYDDFSLCPPSPCDVEFENANIVIDGKSSIRQKSKEATFRVQFNDTLTSKFEYPSEASLIVDDSMTDRYANEYFANAYESLVLEPAITTSASTATTTDSPKHHYHVAVDEIIPLPTPAMTVTGPAPATNNSSPTAKMLGSLPLGSAPLGFYTPVKAPIDNLFQLGVTRAPNGNGLSSHHSSAASPATANTTTTNGSPTVALNGSRCVGGGDGGGDDGNSEPTSVGNSASDEPESLQYLKPANDDLTIAYSEGAQETDLLY